MLNFIVDRAGAITERAQGLTRVFLMLPRWALRAFTAWQQRRPGPTRYIKIPTPEEIEQAQAAARDPNNPASFAALAERSRAKAKEVEARLARRGLWDSHVLSTGIHPLEDNQTCGCPARHIPITNLPTQGPEETEED